MNDRPRCAHCGDIVGVYEAARLLLPDGSEQRGSALTLGDQLGTPGSIVVHERCYDALTQHGGEGRVRAGA